MSVWSAWRRYHKHICSFSFWKVYLFVNMYCTALEWINCLNIKIFIMLYKSIQTNVMPCNVIQYNTIPDVKECSQVCQLLSNVDQLDHCRFLTAICQIWKGASKIVHNVSPSTWNLHIWSASCKFSFARFSPTFLKINSELQLTSQSKGLVQGQIVDFFSLKLGENPVRVFMFLNCWMAMASPKTYPTFWRGWE